jgi:hypothetical protein
VLEIIALLPIAILEKSAVEVIIQTFAGIAYAQSTPLQ